MDSSHSVAAAAATLTGSRWSVSDAPAHVPHAPGLYAIFADDAARVQLQLSDYPADSPLYVGKSEDSLVGRELEGHFAATLAKPARTGQSTVRRSFAALLREELELHAVPRNPNRPERFSNYALATGGDDRLTAWMHAHLTLSVWRKPADAGSLVEIERALIQRWRPPINIKDNPSPWPILGAAREIMRLEAAASVADGVLAAVESTAIRDIADTDIASHGTRAPHAASSPDRPASGFTPAELARSLGVPPKRVRDVLRTRYGSLPRVGDRWGVLTAEQETHVRTRIR